MGQGAGSAARKGDDERRDRGQGCFRIFCPPEANPRRHPPVGYRRACLAADPAARRHRQPVSQPFLARRVPRAARHLAARPRRWCSSFCAVAALYPLRFFRLPRNDEIDRRIERANLLEHTPVRVQTDRPAGDAAAFGQALWREHQKPHGGTARRRRCRPAAHCACPSATRGRCAPSPRCCWSPPSPFRWAPEAAVSAICSRQGSRRARCRRASMPG